MPPASSETAPAAAASTPVVGPTPEWLVHQFDPATDRIALLRMSEAAYRQASFLEQRAIPANAQMRSTDWAAVSASVGPG